jgi:hypothetical protein
MSHISRVRMEHQNRWSALHPILPLFGKRRFSHLLRVLLIGVFVSEGEGELGDLGLGTRVDQVGCEFHLIWGCEGDRREGDSR